MPRKLLTIAAALLLASGALACSGPGCPGGNDNGGPKPRYHAPCECEHTHNHYHHTMEFDRDGCNGRPGCGGYGPA
jgi:hypothetical protein